MLILLITFTASLNNEKAFSQVSRTDFFIYTCCFLFGISLLAIIGSYMMKLYDVSISEDLIIGRNRVLLKNEIALSNLFDIEPIYSRGKYGSGYIGFNLIDCKRKKIFIPKELDNIVQLIDTISANLTSEDAIIKAQSFKRTHL